MGKSYLIGKPTKNNRKIVAAKRRSLDGNDVSVPVLDESSSGKRTAYLRAKKPLRSHIVESSMWTLISLLGSEIVRAV